VGSYQPPTGQRLPQGSPFSPWASLSGRATHAPRLTRGGEEGGLPRALRLVPIPAHRSLAHRNWPCPARRPGLLRQSRIERSWNGDLTQCAIGLWCACGEGAMNRAHPPLFGRPPAPGPLSPQLDPERRARQGPTDGQSNVRRHGPMSMDSIALWHGHRAWPRAGESCARERSRSEPTPAGKTMTMSPPGAETVTP
jgi:hypothetical protein